MELSLFDFDFTEANENMLSDERVSEQFTKLQKLFKARKNSYFMGISDLPRDMTVYIDEFEKRGWIERRNSRGINIPDEYLMYHTPEEVIDEFKHFVDQVMARPNISWYEDVLPVINHASMPFRYRNDEDRDKTYRMKKEVIKDAAMKLGLKHFIEVPSSRGHKMNPFPSKWSKDNVLPMVAELIIPITDYDEMEKFFHTHVFFMGRRDWEDGFKQGFEIPPYPEFKRFSPSYFDIACLCEAEDEKAVKLVLDYSGSVYGYSEKNNDLTVIYPKGWSMEKYESTLTDKDRELIRKDKERLKRLHSHKYSA